MCGCVGGMFSPLALGEELIKVDYGQFLQCRAPAPLSTVGLPVHIFLDRLLSGECFFFNPLLRIHVLYED